MKPGDAPPPTREEFDDFVCVLLHDLRNRLNGIALEAADVAEQAGPQVDAAGLQRQVRECATFLKTLRELAVPDDPQVAPAPVLELIRKLKRREIS